MSGDGYGYYYPPPNFAVDPNQQNWSQWSIEQQQYNNSVRNAVQHHDNVLNAASNHNHTAYGVTNRQNYYNANRPYQQRRFNNSNPPFSGNQPNWQRNNNYKRPRPQDSPNDLNEPKGKGTKKKKKPLSQNVPSKKDWTLEEAEAALAVEKEYNKRYKNHALIIKFPDQELNRDIVSKFHDSIENVHFQQPSTPRFCFVTLKESADAEAVISALNKIKFGEGHLTAEYKKDREEDQVIGPEDIDPCTLYVGNLAQEITKEDMVKTYPKGRRIDIGYAKKMKYTRYAFVSFKSVADSIEAFKKTHSTQMYSKSLIVRFRRLHGTVGMPGESKPQAQPKRTEPNVAEKESDKSESEARDILPDSSGQTAAAGTFDLSVVKQEVNSSDSDDEGIEETTGSKDYESPFATGSIDLAFEKHRPMVKQEIKEEPEDDFFKSFEENAPKLRPVQVKTEPCDVKAERNEDDSDEDESVATLGDVNFSKLLNELDRHSTQIESLKKMTS